MALVQDIRRCGRIGAGVVLAVGLSFAPTPAAQAQALFSDNFDNDGLSATSGEYQYLTGFPIGAYETPIGWMPGGSHASHVVNYGTVTDPNWAIMLWEGQVANTLETSSPIAAANVLDNCIRLASRLLRPYT